jgi:hypothetical protein
VDPVSQVTLTWLEQRAARRGAQEAAAFSIESGSMRLEFSQMVYIGVLGAVEEVVQPGQQEVVLATFLEEDPPGRAVAITHGANLPQTLHVSLLPEFEALAERGIEVDGARFSEVLTSHIASGLETAAEQERLPPHLQSYLRMPGGSFDDISQILNEIDNEDDETEPNTDELPQSEPPPLAHP